MESYRPSSTRFEDKTSYRDGYVGQTGEKQMSFKPTETALTSGAFDGTTTQKSDFTPKENKICPVELINAGRSVC